MGILQQKNKIWIQYLKVKGLAGSELGIARSQFVFIMLFTICLVFLLLILSANYNDNQICKYDILNYKIID